MRRTVQDFQETAGDIRFTLVFYSADDRPFRHESVTVTKPVNENKVRVAINDVEARALGDWTQPESTLRELVDRINAGT